VTVEEGTIRIKRIPAPWRDRSRAYKVMIDGKDAGSIREDEELVTSVAAGAHRVRVKIDWTGSEEIRVDVEPGMCLSFVCEPAAASASALLDLVRRRPWVSLRLE
jgi:hypothetical protein